jgi:hypothetical protein
MDYKMKTLIQETPEESGSKYQIYVEVKDSIHPTDKKHLLFSSVWTGAKNPQEHRTQYEVMLDQNGINNLKTVLGLG